ncbi:hypothetical protein HY256_11655 [Candidatus Sumerlaeota bacterium]|nr:hypothetical protein [Candidatus Sumerlaeota bacterium]
MFLPKFRSGMLIRMPGNPIYDSRTLPRPMTVIKWLVYVIVPVIFWMGLNFDTLRQYFAERNLMRHNADEVVRLETAKKTAPPTDTAETKSDALTTPSLRRAQ